MPLSLLIKEKHREMKLADLKLIYPASVLEANGYFKSYERNFDWYFDPKYCNYARFQDYQRIVLRNNVSNSWIYASFSIRLRRFLFLLVFPYHV